MARRKKKSNKKLKAILISQVILLTLILGALAVYFFGGYATKIKELRVEADQLVKDSTEETFRASQTSVVYDVNGKEITVVKGEKDSYYLAYDNIPEGVKAAIVSIEDKKFYKHRGVDFKAIVRAGVAMLKNQKITQGGSTITQQLARTVFLSNEKSWERKVEEIFIAVGLEKKYSKEQILEFYLNNVYFGNGYYGIEAAARGYFSKGVNELELAEQALLCGVPNNPTIYDPVENPQNAISRRDRILKQMYDDGKILYDTYEEETSKTLTLKRPKRKKYDYVETYTYYCATRALMEQNGFVFQTEFADAAAKEAYTEAYDEMYADCQKSLFTGGYRIYTSIDLNIQKELQQAIDDGLSDFTDTTEEGIYKLQSSGVCIDNETGRVTAIVGGRSQDFNGYTLNRAYQSFRQPGSSIKPLIVYTPQLERGYSPDSIVKDEKFEGGPSNSNGRYSGNITLRHAVEQSKNTIAWKLLEELTPAVGLEYLKQMNFAKLDARDEVPAVALGGFTYGMSAVEMASGYAAIENDGVYREPTCIARIEGADGTILYEATAKEKQVYEQNAARTMTDILKGVMTVGTAKGLDLGAMPSAGKTGTTNDHKDGWFCGFTRYYTTAVWVGYDSPQEMKDLYGSTYPGHIWQDFMKKLHENKEPLDFMPYVSYNDSIHVAEPEPEEEPEQEPEEPPVDIPGEVTEPEEPVQPEDPVEIPGETEPEEPPEPEEPETPEEPAEPEEPVEPEEPEEGEGEVIIID
ncbi:MAG: PBP1A family penicillin-binding protein [bacterium]|nr:PBP1A family penicillin-binding protein [bacterium]MDY4099460.1 PBP1A family penicillin-binding protein [Lachnospiraceae bacterium]